MLGVTGLLSFNTIRAKFLAFVVPLVLLSTIAVFGLFELNARHDANLKLQDKLDKLVAIQSAVIAESLWNIADEQIKLILAALAIDPDVESAAVYDERDQLVGVTGTADEMETRPFFASKEIIYVDDGEPEVIIGRLEVSLSDARLQSAAVDRMFLAGGLAAILLISVVFSSLLGNRRTIGIPLERLLESINHSRESGERQAVDWRSNDEIGAVVSAFNEMQERQKAYERELEEARDTLERRVEERTHELNRAQQILTDAIESISEGFSLYDADDQLVVCNDMYRKILHPGIEHTIQTGVTFETVVRSAAEAGYFKDAEGRIDAWVSERVAQHQNPSGPLLQQQSDGRWTQISERKTEDDGTVAIYTDITELKSAQEELQAAYRIIKDQKDRMEDELNVGREIQMSMVPLTFPPFPNRNEFSVYGSLEPAREIGGDFFDFFFVDDNRLCFCIGDVSGKGVPAALFMAVTKTLIKSRATDDRSTASILTHVNDELSRDNPNGMFVTLFIGILNIRSGEFDYTNAGHNPPYLIRTDGPPEALSDRHGPVIGAVKGKVYRKGTNVMHAGDILYMYTDGVTEEMDTEGQLFSDERLAALISTQTIDSVEAAVDKTISAVESFRGEKDAEDDVTVLAIQFFGDPMKASAAGLHVIVKNELSEITTVQQRFQEFGKAHGFSKDLERKMDMIIDELLGNVILYAFSEDSEHEIEITAEQVRNRLTITISDDGVPFNPLLKDTPDTSLAAKDRDLGGLGILLVRKMADDILYQRRIDKNVLTLIIHVDRSDDES